MNHSAKYKSKTKTANKYNNIFQSPSANLQQNEPVFKLPKMFVQQHKFYPDNKSKSLSKNALVNRKYWKQIQSEASNREADSKMSHPRQSTSTKHQLSQIKATINYEKQEQIDRHHHLLQNKLAIKSKKPVFDFDVIQQNNPENSPIKKYVKKPFKPFRGELIKQEIRNKKIKIQTYLPDVEVVAPVQMTPLQKAKSFYRFSKVSEIDEEFVTFLSQLIRDSKTYSQQVPLCSTSEVLSLKKIFKKGFFLCSKNQEGKEQFLTEEIVQGNIPNCSFVSSLTSLAYMFPKIVSRLILFRENPYGYYVVRLFIDGQWTSIVIDDKFPIQSETKKCFAKQKDSNIIWSILMQKAYIKAHNSYNFIENYPICYALHALTGAPSRFIQLKSQTRQFVQNYIVQGFQSKHILVCSTSHFEADKANGLLTNHAYSLLDYIKIKTPYLQTLLLKLRNPWGYQVWKGAWSHNSKQWTKQLKQQHKNWQQNPKNGTFYICLEDFELYFVDVSRCFIEEKWKHSCISLTVVSSQQSYVKLGIMKTSKYVFTVHQQESARRESNNLQADKKQNSISILKVDNGRYEYVDSNTSFGTTELTVVLEEGEYYGVVSIYNQFEVDVQATLSSYGEQKIQLQFVDLTVEQEQALVSDKYQSFSKIYTGTVTAYKQVEGATKQVYFDKNYEPGYIKICNPTKVKFISKITIDPSHEVYFSLYYKYKSQFDENTNILETVVEPQSQILISFKTSSIGTTNYEMPEEIQIIQ